MMKLLSPRRSLRRRILPRLGKIARQATRQTGRKELQDAAMPWVETDKKKLMLRPEPQLVLLPRERLLNLEFKVAMLEHALLRLVKLEEPSEDIPF